MDLLEYFFTEMQKTPGNVGQTKAYEQEIVFINSKTDLWVSYEKNTQESPKKQITLQLPEEQALYTSFDARNSAGCVRYYIIVQAFNSGHSTLKRKLLFPVVCPKNLGKDPLLSQLSMQTINLEKSKVLEKGNVTAKLHLKKRGYVPGEPLQGQITIDNRSSKSINARELLRDARNGLAHPKILANSSLTYPIKFYVPALLPNLSVPECIEADYCLCLDVDWKRASQKRNFLQIKTPIIIGTHPTNELPGQISDLPPPPYEERANGVTHTFADMPPSYAVSVGGVSELGGKEAENNLLNATNKWKFMPLFATITTMLSLKR
uniref:Arrestin C-terminal-like domain-containing protein n=1 Tax=Ditylenchus dipsaci TaxID=166011 RepID=A0A915CS46_9BILA